MSKIYQKMYLTNKKRSEGVLDVFIDKVILRSFYSESHPLSFKRAGFTLIELLVVVLIIGILAAVALPQYEKAVMKARLAAILPVVDGLKKGHELFYLQNGYYEADTSKLSVQHPCTGTDVLVCSGGFMIDNLGGSTGYFIRLNYCPEVSDWNACEAAKDYSIYFYLEHSSTTPGATSCLGYTKKGRSLCSGISL